MILVSIPVVVSSLVAVAILLRHRGGPRWSNRLAWAMIGLLTLVAMPAILSVGAFMLPVVVLLGLSVKATPPPTRQRGAQRTSRRSPEARPT